MAAGPTYLDAARRRYGDRVLLDLGPYGTYVYLADPQDIRTVFLGDEELLRGGEANAPFLAPLLGETSVLVCDGQAHLARRRHLSGALSRGAVDALVPTMREVAAESLRSWPVGRAFRAIEQTRRITLEVILRTVIGTSEAALLAELRPVLAGLAEIGLLQMAQFPFPALRRLPYWRALWERKATADALIRRQVARTATDPGLADRHDVLATLVRESMAGQGLAMGEIADQVLTLLMAGHETTATALAWTLERLVRHPSVLRRAEEAAAAGDDRYLEALVAESLRVRPVVPEVSRRLSADMALGGHRLPGGAYVNPAIALVHRSPALYVDPFRFDPDRFVDHRPDPLNWMPFGGGSRRCLGATFALTEMKVVLKELLAHLELAATTRGGEWPRMRHVTLVPWSGAVIEVKARRRHPSD